MTLTLKQYKNLFAAKNESGGRSSGVIPPNEGVMLWDEPVTPNQRWGKCHPPNKCVGVPYTFKPNTTSTFFTQQQIEKIEQAIMEIEQSTCIRYFI